MIALQVLPWWVRVLPWWLRVLPWRLMVRSCLRRIGPHLVGRVGHHHVRRIGHHHLGRVGRRLRCLPLGLWTRAHRHECRRQTDEYSEHAEAMSLDETV